MFKAWIRFTTTAAVFFLICLSVFLFMNKPLHENLWEEALLIVSVANLILVWIYYKRNKDEFDAAKRKKKE